MKYKVAVYRSNSVYFEVNGGKMRKSRALWESWTVLSSQLDFSCLLTPEMQERNS